MCVVRLLLRQADRVFCVPRPDTARLDLPMPLVGQNDSSGVGAISGLAERITGSQTQLTFVGAVRNIVESPHDGYAWPTPRAHFGVWTSENAPVVDGTWVSVGEDSPLRDRHWFALVR